MNRTIRLAALLAPLACVAFTTVARAECKILQVAEFAVSDRGNRPLLDGMINGQPIKVLVDTGATTSVMWEDQARELGLSLVPNPYAHTYGATGKDRVLQTSIKHLRIGSLAINDQDIAVIGSSGDHRGSEAALILGENFLANFTTEFDLAHGVMRLLRPQGCQPEQMVYWNKPYSLAELEPTNINDPSIELMVNLNGKQVRALLDSGASTSIISTSAARRVGVKVQTDAGTSFGIAGKPIATSLGVFDDIQVGDETVRNVTLRIADLFERDKEVQTGAVVAAPVGDFPTMLLGGDFFQSHRVIVMLKERKLLFTYNGGPIFQVRASGDDTSENAPISGSAPTRETNGNTPVPGNTPSK